LGITEFPRVKAQKRKKKKSNTEKEGTTGETPLKPISSGYTRGGVGDTVSAYTIGNTGSRLLQH